MQIYPLLVAGVTLTLSTLWAPSQNSDEPAEPPQGMVTFTLDDGYKSQLEYGLPLLKKYNILGTTFLISGPIDVAAGDPTTPYMNWQEIAEWDAEGWEIGAHTESHSHLTQASDAELMAELSHSASRIFRELGTYPTTFASPYGDYDERVLNQVKQLYDAHVGAWGGLEGMGDGFNNLSTVDPFTIGRWIIKRDMYPEIVCGKIIEAGQKGLWLVITFHQILPSPKPGDEGAYEVSTALFEKILACASKEAERGTIRIESIEDALATKREGDLVYGIKR